MDQNQWFQKKPYNANGGKNYSGQNSGWYSRWGENQRWNSGSYDSQNPKAKTIYVNCEHFLVG